MVVPGPLRPVFGCKVREGRNSLKTKGRGPSTRCARSGRLFSSNSRVVRWYDQWGGWEEGAGFIRAAQRASIVELARNLAKIHKQLWHISNICQAENKWFGFWKLEVRGCKYKSISEKKWKTFRLPPAFPAFQSSILADPSPSPELGRDVGAGLGDPLKDYLRYDC